MIVTKVQDSLKFGMHRHSRTISAPYRKVGHEAVRLRRERANYLPDPSLSGLPSEEVQVIGRMQSWLMGEPS